MCGQWAPGKILNVAEDHESKRLFNDVIFSFEMPPRKEVVLRI